MNTMVESKKISISYLRAIVKFRKALKELSEFRHEPGSVFDNFLFAVRDSNILNSMIEEVKYANRTGIWPNKSVLTERAFIKPILDFVISNSNNSYIFDDAIILTMEENQKGNMR